MSSATTPIALLVSKDLFFTSKITGTSGALGIPMQVVAHAQGAASAIQEHTCLCVFVDLADSGLDIAEIMKIVTEKNPIPVVAFGSHVQTARLQEARRAGCSEVMPRSQFSAELPQILTKYCLNTRHPPQ